MDCWEHEKVVLGTRRKNPLSIVYVYLETLENPTESGKEHEKNLAFRHGRPGKQRICMDMQNRQDAEMFIWQ